jgi:hypothetical protein
MKGDDEEQLRKVIQAVYIAVSCWAVVILLVANSCRTTDMAKITELIREVERKCSPPGNVSASVKMERALTTEDSIRETTQELLKQKKEFDDLHRN